MTTQQVMRMCQCWIGHTVGEIPNFFNMFYRENQDVGIVSGEPKSCVFELIRLSLDEIDIFRLLISTYFLISSVYDRFAIFEKSIVGDYPRLEVGFYAK